MRTTRLDCGHVPSKHDRHTTGYGIDLSGKTACWSCCAVRDRETMIREGSSRSLPLYTDGKGSITNWPGSLKFTAFRRTTGRHNIGGAREDVWFNGPDGYVWHGVQVGGCNQICRAKRTAVRAR